MIKKLVAVLLSFTLFACSGADDAAKPATPGAATAGNTGFSLEKYAEGTHYLRIASPVATGSDKIVVTEFFWYGCPHCEHFEPLLQEWEKTRPADVELQRVPAVWRDIMKLHAKVYFLVETLPNRDFVHSALFTEIIGLHEVTSEEEQKQRIGAALGRFGVSDSAYQAALQSPEIDARVARAEALMKQAGVTGTPAIMVNGKYLVNNKAIKGLEDLIAITDFLIAKDRSKP